MRRLSWGGGASIAKKLLGNAEIVSVLGRFQQVLQSKGVQVHQLRELPHQQIREMVMQDKELLECANTLQQQLAKLDVSYEDMIQLSKTFGTPLPPGFEEFAKQQEQKPDKQE